MTNLLSCCGGERQWSRASHKPDCPRLAELRGKSGMHPALRPAAVPPSACTAHPLEDRYDCPACEQISDEWQEAR